MREEAVVYTYMESPSGTILLARREAGLTRINFQEGMRPFEPGESWRRDAAPLHEATEQMRAYFEGERQTFDLPLAAEGTSFQQKVWAALLTIPCGETVTYGDIARRIGRPTASRAVGAANGRNPLPIVVPCHRVIGANGKLTGFAGGLTIKKALLDHEAELTRQGQLTLPAAASA